MAFDSPGPGGAGMSVQHGQRRYDPSCRRHRPCPAAWFHNLRELGPAHASFGLVQGSLHRSDRSFPLGYDLRSCRLTRSTSRRTTGSDKRIRYTRLFPKCGRNIDGRTRSFERRDKCFSATSKWRRQVTSRSTAGKPAAPKPSAWLRANFPPAGADAGHALLRGIKSPAYLSASGYFMRIAKLSKSL
jgi:hypothetical protein